MNPISIRNRTPAESSAIQRQMKAARMRKLFDDIESQLTDPVLIEMTRGMRDTVMANPEFAEPPFEVTCDREALERFRAHPDVVEAKAERDRRRDEKLKMMFREHSALRDAEAQRAGLSRWAYEWMTQAQQPLLHFPATIPFQPWDSLGQELLDAGLVARTIHADGKVTYRLTDAGKAWRAAC